ncbi:hypothetical protein BGZ76_001617 [Entomortierella beljakovae]|nr:hypothetical protein BGZ76_001617 [Entomortierella beljakovae]
MPGMYFEQLSSMEAPPAEEEPKQNPVFNIVLLGQTQAGKSTLLQAIRRYADPDCTVNDLLIGDGNQSHTQDVNMGEIETDFPEYDVYQNQPEDQETYGYYGKYIHRALSNLPVISGVLSSKRKFNVESYLNCPMKEYRKRIHRSDDLEIVKSDRSDSPYSTIRVFDTPGLEDTNGKDEENVAKILTSLSKEDAVHLVLIVISKDTPLTLGLKAALETYNKIFSAMHGVMAIVHSKFGYDHQHPENDKTKKLMDSKKRTLNDLMGRPMLHFLLDCNLEEEDKPIHIYLRQKKIREILLNATYNIPVKLSSMQLYKTKKMREVDSIVNREQKKLLGDIEKECILLDKHTNLDFRINDYRYKIRELNDFIMKNDTSTEELMHEERYDESWGFFSSRNEVELRANLPHNIDKIAIHSDGIDVLHKDGGQGSNWWYVKVKRRWFQHGVHHAKMYVLRRNKMRHELHEKTVTREELEKKLGILQMEKDAIRAPPTKDKEELVRKQKVCLNLITRSERDTLHLSLFKALVRNHTYDGELVDCADKITEFYATYIPADGEEAGLI